MISWSAIARGAAVKGLEGDGINSVLTRKSRRHYGTAVSPCFKSGVHLETDAYIDNWDLMKRARNQTSWLIRKGQDMDASMETHSRTTICAHFWPGERRSMSMKLIACDADHSPMRSVHEVSEAFFFVTIY
jgi:hypothetical protein